MPTNKPGCLFGLLSLVFSPSQRVQPLNLSQLPYRLRDDYLSPAELNFYRVLILAVGGRALICPKVNLKDIFFVTNRTRYVDFFRRISQKHVDFLLCHPDSMKPICGVELDDLSHLKSKTQDRDRFVDAVFRAAGLPLVRVPARQGYVVADIEKSLNIAMTPFALSASDSQLAATTSIGTGSAAGALAAGAPTCPKCGVAMVIRQARRGSHAGQYFYGCVNYPRCEAKCPVPPAASGGSTAA